MYEYNIGYKPQMSVCLSAWLSVYLSVCLYNLLQMWPSIYWKTVQSLSGRFRAPSTIMKNPFADNKCEVLKEYFSVGLCSNANYKDKIIENYLDLEEMTMVHLFLE